MGIKNLSQLLKVHCKKSIKERPISYYSNKKIAIDASMFIYQFLIAVRADGSALMGEDSITSHLVGLFYRNIRLVDNGIIPVYVFDGKPPEIKMFELKKRTEKREKADEEYKKAELAEDKVLMEKHEKRRIKVNMDHVNECKKLLDLMGMPYVTAPSEAEAFCAYLCKKKYVHGVATEDMDALTFGSPILLRNFTAAQNKKLPIVEYNLESILKELEINMNEFIDLCIILGCDYCDSLKNIGIKRGINLIKKYKTLEKILEYENVDKNFVDFKAAREMFKSLSEIDMEVKEFKIRWDEIIIDDIKKFLVDDKKFDESRIVKGIEKFLNCRNKTKQTSLDGFFRKK
ncbi:flap endonuclease-1 [Vairimorpha apis BRL 01]|uniref:Flap endonuclease 1 n=1 Tax=Vairimorpha apis BRL 01 TaxID=1037528 RepID=T0L4C9_9MICR|nr:flap endonuclease-1 [Vairimorpha apis BRL 01]